MPKLVWRVKLVAELEPGVATETELARIERSEEAGPAELGLRLEEAKRLTATLQAEIVTAQGEPKRSVALPAGAVVHRRSEASVWVALDGNRFVLRRIAIGNRSGDMLEVTEGLNAGERVVTGGALFIDRAARID